MNRSSARFTLLAISLLLMIHFTNGTAKAEPIVQIRSPKDGSHIADAQNYVLVGGKVGSETGRSGYVDIVFVLDVSGSTAHYAGLDFSEFSQLPNFYVYPGKGRLGGWPGPQCPALPGGPGPLNLRNSILAAEIVASRRLLSQLNPETTRVGVITFGDHARLMLPLTHDFEEVRRALDVVHKSGPYGGTNMSAAIELATQELLTEKRSETVKALLLLTDGFPTLPVRDCTSQANADLAIDAARVAAKAGINVHVFALGKEALSQPRAAVGIAKASGGTYTPVLRPADVLAVVDKVSAVGVDSIQVTNQTIQQKALQSRLAADGFFAAAVPVVEGLNRIAVLARASDGSVGRDSITVHYQAGGNRSLELEVFLEREKSLELEVERLGKSPEQIEMDVERNREEGLKKSKNPAIRADKISREE